MQTTNGSQLQRTDTTTAAPMAALPDWMKHIREAVTGAISATDLKAILQVQVEKAKKGDEKAARFVLDQAKAFADLRGVQITQNNFYGGEQPDKPTDAVPGTSKKLDAIRRRVAMGLPTDNPHDREDVDLS